MLNEAVVERMNQPRLVKDEPEYIIDSSEEAPKAWEEFLRVHQMSEKDRREHLLHEAIDDFQKRRELLREQSNNHWMVYSICKQIAQISELEGDNFKDISLLEKFRFARSLLRFIDADVIYEGVAEFHYSGWCLDEF